MDALRKQLDSLMGANRNGDVQVVKRKYYDGDVCRLYTAGLCPHDLFQLTKMDLGACPKIHSLQLRKEYEEAKAKGKDNYDRDLEEGLKKVVYECERKIERALKRLEEEDAKAATAISVLEVTKTPEAAEYSRQIKGKLKEAEYMDLEGRTDEKIRIMEQVEELRAKRADRQGLSVVEAFNKDRASMPQPLQLAHPLAPLPLAPDARTQEIIKEKMQKAEELGEDGRVDEAQRCMEEADALKKLVRASEPRIDFAKQVALDVRITDQKLRICDICGAFLSVYDSDRRLADHFGGKLHLGYIQIREKLEDLEEGYKKVCKAEGCNDERGFSRDRDRLDGDTEGGDGGRHNKDRTPDWYSRERDRERDWGQRESDRRHDRVRDREGHGGHRSRSRSRSRSRDCGNSRYRERDHLDYHRDSHGNRYDRR